jgi:hypothetical protein
LGNQNFFHGSENIATDTATKSVVTKDTDPSSITHPFVSKANSSFSLHNMGYINTLIIRFIREVRLRA